MANAIDLVVGTAVKDQIEKLMTELTEVDNKIQAIGNSAVAMNKALGVKDTASLTKLTAENEKLNKKIQELTGSSAVLETKLANLAAAQSKATKAATDASIAEEKLIAATNKNTTATEKKTKATAEDTVAQREATAQSVLRAKAGEGEAKTYAQLDAQHKQAVKTAQDLAVANGRTGKDYEAAKLRANELGKQLKVVDTDIGKHTRNVGNYSSSWNGLGNSINQLTREAPAFANSVQTGFMALSNNIPILTDELGVLIQKNKDLQKDGKPTESILKTVAGAFFSWQTAISLGVTILTVYGAKIWDMVSGLDALKKKQEAFALSQKLMDDKIEQTTKNILHQGEMRKNAAILAGASADDIRTIDLQTQKDVQANLILRRDSDKKKYENAKYYSDLENEREKINTKIALAGGLFKYKLSEEQAKLKVKLEKNTAELIRYENWKQTSQGLADMKNAAILSENAVKEQGRKITLLKSGQKVEEFNEDKKNQKNIDKENAKNDKTAEENAKNAFDRKISDLEKQKEIDSSSLDFFSGTLQERQILSAKVAADEVAIVEATYQEELRLAEGNADLIAAAENRKFIAVSNIRDENIKRVQGYYKEEEDIQAESLKDQLESEKRQANLLKELEDIVDKEAKDSLKKQADYLKSFTDEFASKSGFPETFNMLSGQIEGFGENAGVTFNAISESAQEMFNMINESSQASFDAEYARLDAQKNEALKNAGDSTAAKEKIEADYAAKKKEIQLREFKQKQKMSVVNIAIDTAQAIIATIAATPLPAGLPLAIMVGAMGAIQAGIVLAQKPPAYAEGTDNHSGGLMLVNDGAGSNFQEKVILPSGKVIRPQGRNVLMDAPKGTKVLNHEQQLFEMLQSNNISMSSPQYQGMTPDEMDEILGKHFSNIKTQNTIFDKNGFQSYVRNGNSITRSNSNRSQAIGISV